MRTPKLRAEREPRRLARGHLLLLGLASAIVLAASAYSETPFVTEGVAPFESAEGERIALSVDASGAPHIAFMKGSFFITPVRYATKSGGMWTVEQVDVGMWTTNPAVSIDVDAIGQPSLVYTDWWDSGFGYELNWARKAAGVWSVEIASIPIGLGCYGYGTGGDNSLALDQDGFPCIGYTYEIEDVVGDCFPFLAYARRDATGWQASGVHSRAGNGCALALTPQGSPHLSYVASESGQANLTYARLSGGLWNREAVAPGAPPSTAIDLDAQGNPHIAYRGGSTSWKHAYKAAGVWQIETALSTPNVLSWIVSLKLDAWGNPHICGVDLITDDLLYVSKVGGLWSVETIDGPNSLIGPSSSMQLANGSSPRVAYRDATNGELRYAQAQKRRVDTREGSGALAQTASLPNEWTLGNTITIRPNPSINGHSTILFAQFAGDASKSAEIYDVSGRRVATISVLERALGIGEASWNGKSDAGDQMPAGTYVVRVKTTEGERTSRLTLLR